MMCTTLFNPNSVVDGLAVGLQHLDAALGINAFAHFATNLISCLLMGTKAQLTESDRGQTDAYAAQGLNASRIAATVGRSRKTVTNYLRDLAGYGTHFTKGRPKKLKARDCRRVARAARQGTMSSSKL
jgi:DNA-binding CsgD family transcriptional regulator